MPQRKFAQDADGKVQGNGHNHISADGNKLSLQGRGDIAAHDHGLYDEESDDNDSVGDGVIASFSKKLFDLFHIHSPTLSH